MMYYHISSSTNEKEVGCYYQTKGLPEEHTSKWYDKPNSMTNLTDSTFPNFIPDLKWELKEEAILTDLVSASNITATGFLMNEKTKAVFQAFNLSEHKFYPAFLIIKNQTLFYYYLHLHKMDFKEIDYQKSSFSITNVFGIKDDDISIFSSDDLIEKQNKLELGHVISVERLSINTPQAPDLFFFSIIHNDIFISQNLLNELGENNITGYQVTAQNILEI